MSTSNAEVQLAHLFYMGLMWLRNENPAELTRSGASVFSSYILGGDLPRSVQTNIEQSYGLMKLVESQSEVVTGKQPSKRELRKILSSSDKLNVILASRGEFELEQLFAPEGYRHAITDAGIELAQSVMSKYTSIDEQRFLKGWGKHKNKMRAMNAKKPTQRGVQAASSEGGGEKDISHIIIPPAPYRGKEEW